MQFELMATVSGASVGNILEEGYAFQFAREILVHTRFGGFWSALGVDLVRFLEFALLWRSGLVLP